MGAAIQIQSQPMVSTTDALWSLIMNQSKSIQKTLAKRLAAYLEEEKRVAQEKYVRDTLTSAMREVRKAHAEGRQLPDARRLFDEFVD